MSNYNCLAAVFLIICLSMTNMLLGQREFDLVEMEALDTTNKTAKAYWSLAFDVSSPAAILLGASGVQDGFIGVQLNRRVNQWGVRFSGRFYPNYYQSTWFPSAMIVDLEGEEAQFLAIQNDGAAGQISFGLVRSKSVRLGRIYGAIDVNFNYGRETTEAYTYWKNPVVNRGPVELDDEPSNSFIAPRNSITTNDIGPGITPALGYSLHLGKHFGLDLEAQTNMNLIISEGFMVQDNAVITRTGTNYYFQLRTLLNARVHYRF